MRRSFPGAISAVLALLALAACRPTPPQSPQDATVLGASIGRLPTGVSLDPAAPQHPVLAFPLGMAMAPDSGHIAMSMNGWGEQGVQIVDRATGAVTQTLPQRAAFIGIAFSPDGHALYASGGNQDVIYRYDWAGGRAALRDSIVLAVKPNPRWSGTRYPAGIAFSPDGRTLYAAENLADSLAVIDVASGQVVHRYATGAYPYAVVVSPTGQVFVSAWGGYTVSEFTPAGDGYTTRAIPVGRHPSALLLNKAGTRLFVASGSTDRVIVVGTGDRRVVETLLDPPPAGPGEGSTPNALALSPDGTRLFVAEADANAIAVFDLTPETSGVSTATGNDLLAGRIPTAWYPSLVSALHDTLFVATSKGMGTRANPAGPWPILSAAHSKGRNYTLGQLDGSVMFAPVANARGAELAALTQRVVRANAWDGATDRTGAYPPFTHVIYIIKENRTYDEVFGDMTSGDGDSSLVFFPRKDSPNHHAIADRFGLFDRFFVNAEVSADGHNWSTAGYATDYLEKTVQSQYSERGRPYEYEGAIFGADGTKIPEEDANAPANGYLWDLAHRKGITFRNYGEFVVPGSVDADDPLPAGYRGDKPFLKAHTDPDYPGLRPQHPRPAPHGHVAEGVRCVRAQRLAAGAGDRAAAQRSHLGRGGRRADAAGGDGRQRSGAGPPRTGGVHSPYWKNTVIFVLEDDAQNGPDHVDSHRSPMEVISAYNRPGTIHRWTNTTDVLRTIEEILGLRSMSQFDYYGRPLRHIWASTPDLTPYTALTPATSLDALNPSRGRGALESRQLDLKVEDMANMDVFNHILWRQLKGDSVPYPGTHRVSAQQIKTGS